MVDVVLITCKFTYLVIFLGHVINMSLLKSKDNTMVIVLQTSSKTIAYTEGCGL